MKNKLLAIVALAALFSSCTVEKRHYMSGYHVDWHTRTAKVEKNKNHNSEETAVDAHETAIVESQNTSEESSELVIEVRTEKVLETSAVEPVVVAEQPIEKSKKESRENKKAEKNFNRLVSKAAELSNVSSNVSVETTTFEASSDNTSSSETDKVLLVVLAIFIPPLAVYLYEGSWTKRCTVNLILTLLCGIPGIIHALIVVLE